KESDFEIVTTEAREPGDGEVLVRNIWMSVDPYMRGRMMDRESYVPPFQIGSPLEGGAIGQVVGSKSDKLKVGTYVNHMLGWREFATGPAGGFTPVDPTLGP
ncbi:MAG TPA: NADP-dependent oxidoreductase, partial [Rhodobiaceae bacterium]|nr:NADP-dependent oxidoreductase [Rhodobiaceae bacterium]